MVDLSYLAPLGKVSGSATTESSNHQRESKEDYGTRSGSKKEDLFGVM